MLLRLRPSLGAVMAVLLAASVALPVPYLVLKPGPVFNTIGEFGGQQVVDIQEATTYPTSGSLDMTTVSEFGGPQDGVSVFQAVWGWLDPAVRVVPREIHYPENATEADTKLRNAEAFNSSQSYAVAAALQYLKLPVQEQVVVTSIVEGSPALDNLRAQDAIVSIDDVAMNAPEEVVAAVRAKPAGSNLVFKVLREGSPIEVSVTSAPKKDDLTTPEDETGKPFIGIGVDDYYAATFPITFHLRDIGGPSAGSMFALAIIDKLTPGELTAGKNIAGTGTVDPQGNVGAIGGIAQKLAGAHKAGATLFLAPQSNCDEVIGNIPQGLTVVPVETIAQAVKAIETFNSGGSLAKCTDTPQ